MVSLSTLEDLLLNINVILHKCCSAEQSNNKKVMSNKSKSRTVRGPAKSPLPQSQHQKGG